MKVKCRIFVEEGAEIPKYADDHAVGADLSANIKESVWVYPGKWDLIPTGIYIELPEGYEAQIRPRSGLATKGITVLNTPGTIDPNYRGEIKVILINHSLRPITILPGMRIAQMVIAPYTKGEFDILENKEDLSSTERGEEGFGHTGQ